MRLRREVYSGLSNLNGDQHYDTLREANNYANSLIDLQRFEEAKSLMRKMMPVARRVLRENHDCILMMRWAYARALYQDTGATLDDLREAVDTLEELERTARRVLGGAHPDAVEIEKSLREARAELNAQLRAAYKEDPSSLSADDCARAEQLLARDARKAAKKAARSVSSETPPSPPPSESV